MSEDIVTSLKNSLSVKTKVAYDMLQQRNTAENVIDEILQIVLQNKKWNTREKEIKVAILGHRKRSN